MKTYIINLSYETEIEANSPEEAEEQFFIDIEGEPQLTFDSFIQHNLIIKEKGKHCKKCGITLSDEYELEDQQCAQCSNEPRPRKLKTKHYKCKNCKRLAVDWKNNTEATCPKCETENS